MPSLYENIDIRKASENDFTIISHLIQKANLDDVALRVNEFLLLKEHDSIIGLGRIRRHGSVQELCSLTVLEKWRNSGLGKKLIAALTESFSEPVYAVTEIPDYFAKSGFKITENYPEVLNDKLQRCVSCYNCNAPVVMVLRPSK